MTELMTTYADTEHGYCTSPILLSGDMVLSVRLIRRGRVCIKKSNTADGPWPKVFMSPNAGPDFRITIYGETTGKYIQVITSEPPEQMRLYKI